MEREKNEVIYEHNVSSPSDKYNELFTWESYSNKYPIMSQTHLVPPNKNKLRIESRLQ